MTVSQSDKQFWIRELTKELRARIVSVLKDAGLPTLIESSKVTAEERLIQALGLKDRMNAIKVDEQKIEHLKKNVEEVEAHKKAIEREIDEIVKPHYVDDGTYHYGGLHYKEMFEQIVEGLYAEVVAEAGDTGEQVAELMKAINNLERTMMIMNSTTQMKEFIIKFTNKYGIQISNGLI